MSDEPANVLTWDKMLAISVRAAEAERETGKVSIVVCGMLAWMGVRALVEERLLSPILGDILVIDTVDWMLSMHVDNKQIKVLPRDMLIQEVPMTLRPIPDGLTLLRGP